MEFSPQPAFEPKSTEEHLPDPEDTNNLTKASRDRMNRTMELAVELTGMEPDNFEAVYSWANDVLRRQQDFRYVSLGPGAPDGAVFVQYHNEVPKLVNRVYTTEGVSGIVGHVSMLPGVTNNFPGMVISTRGLVFGEPTADHNRELVMG